MLGVPGNYVSQAVIASGRFHWVSVTQRGEIRVSYNAREVLRSGGHYSLGSFPEKRRGFSCLTHVADFFGLVGSNC